MRQRLLILVLACLAVAEERKEEEKKKGPIVTTKYGDIMGLVHNTSTGDPVHLFLGIRYGHAPDGLSRFEKALPVEPWEPFVHHATIFRAACVPFDRRALVVENYSEDCLFLNVFAPPHKKGNKLRPVLVFIHGGAFEIGDSETYGYQRVSEVVVNRGIVVVTIQYRLGPLGFFSTGDHVIPGNMGLWDQAQALFFLHEVLPAFGGDPDRITISGHSAGSASVSALLLSPHSNMLFDQAIQMSGSIFAEWAYSETVVEESLALAEACGCKSKESTKIHDCMKERTMEEILDGVEKIGTSRRHPNFAKFQPRWDGDFFSYKLEDLIKQAPKKKTIMGVTDQEAAIFILNSGLEYLADISLPRENWTAFDKEALERFIMDSVATEPEFGRKFGPFRDLLFDFYVERGASKSPDHEFYIQRYVDLLSDLLFNIPVVHELDLKRAAGWSTYFYEVKYYSKHLMDKEHSIHGAYHASDLRFIFNPSFLAAYLTPDDFKFQKVLVDAFVNFIVTGDPSTESFKWNPVSTAEPHAYADLNVKPAMKSKYREEAVDFWLNRVPKSIGVDIIHKTRLPAAKVHKIQHTEL